jgi:hypothetical protein
VQHDLEAFPRYNIDRRRQGYCDQDGSARLWLGQHVLVFFI